MRKSYLTVIILAAVIAFAYYLSGCNGDDEEERTPQFYKIAQTFIGSDCGTRVEFFKYKQRTASNNPVTVAVFNKGDCPITLITDQPGGTGLVERISVAPDREGASHLVGEIPEKTGVVTFDMLATDTMKFLYECKSPYFGNDTCVGEIVVYENLNIENPIGWRVAPDIHFNVTIAKRHYCGLFDKTVFEYINTSTQTQRLKFEAVASLYVWPDPNDWFGYVCLMRFWGFAVPPTGTLMDSIFVGGTPNETTVDIDGRRTFYLKASCLQNPNLPDTTGNFCVGDVRISITQ